MTNGKDSPASLLQIRSNRFQFFGETLQFVLILSILPLEGITFFGQLLNRLFDLFLFELSVFRQFR